MSFRSVGETMELSKTLKEAADKLSLQFSHDSLPSASQSELLLTLSCAMMTAYVAELSGKDYTAIAHDCALDMSTSESLMSASPELLQNLMRFIEQVDELT
jgi:hypothetical protein